MAQDCDAREACTISVELLVLQPQELHGVNGRVPFIALCLAAAACRCYFRPRGAAVTERESLLMEEYKACQQALQDKDKSIWQTFGILGAGTMASLALVVREPSPSAEGALALGLLTTGAAFAWWVMANRWWQLEHTDLLRMRHIERELATTCGAPLRVHYADIRDGGALPALSGVPKADWDRIPLHRHRWYGIQNVMRLFPFVIAVIWGLYIALLTKRGNTMPTWLVPAVTALGGMVVGLIVGTIIGSRTVGTQLNQLRDQVKQLSEKLPPS